MLILDGRDRLRGDDEALAADVESRFPERLLARPGRDRHAGEQILQGVAAQAFAGRPEQLLGLEIDLGGMGDGDLDRPGWPYLPARRSSSMNSHALLGWLS